MVSIDNQKVRIADQIEHCYKMGLADNSPIIQILQKRYMALDTIGEDSIHNACETAYKQEVEKAQD